jgi:choline dehydrogenase-like flavoprotein
VAHQCGTIRFGLSRHYAVADPECRLFDQPDVFVVDGSFMPSSLGVGPSLTIIANALRVAEIVASEV